MPTNDPPQPGSIYLIAFFAENPVGCGALRKIDTNTAEVRRMYVLSSARRAGIGRALLIRLEREADKLGYTLLKLQTGNRQRAAMALYESYGFRLAIKLGCCTAGIHSVDRWGHAGVGRSSRPGRRAL